MIYDNLDFNDIALISIVRNKTIMQKFNVKIKIKYHKIENKMCMPFEHDNQKGTFDIAKQCIVICHVR